MKVKITNADGTHDEHDLATAPIPDLWHVGQWLKKHDLELAGQAVLDVWHIAHDAQKAAQGRG